MKKKPVDTNNSNEYTEEKANFAFTLGHGNGLEQAAKYLEQRVILRRMWNGTDLQNFANEIRKLVVK